MSNDKLGVLVRLLFILMFLAFAWWTYREFNKK